MFRGKIKIISKIFLAIFVYIFFFVFTPNIYAMAMEFWEKAVSDRKVIILGHSAINVLISDDLIERQKGLSGTEKLRDNEGMFFIFDKEDFHGIWMKDMNYPIDIIWFDRFGSIVYIEENISPDTYPTVFKPSKPAVYVIEVNAGFVEKENIRLGDTIDLY